MIAYALYTLGMAAGLLYSIARWPFIRKPQQTVVSLGPVTELKPPAAPAAPAPAAAPPKVFEDPNLQSIPTFDNPLFIEEIGKVIDGTTTSAVLITARADNGCSIRWTGTYQEAVGLIWQADVTMRSHTHS